MTFGSKHYTKADEARRDAIKAGNCLACAQLGIDVTGQGLVEFHHLPDFKRKLSHQGTVGLCIWHHRGQLLWGHTHQDMREEYGPALSEGSKPFKAKFGSDAFLLETQNSILEGC